MHFSSVDIVINHLPAVDMTSTTPHPHADGLFVTTRHRDGDAHTVVTSVPPEMQDKYDTAWAGDKADGVTVGVTRVRGIWSYGMLTDQPIKRSTADPRFFPWPSINQLPQIKKNIDRDAEVDADTPVMFRGKTKLHGTNAAVRRHRDGSITAQSRSRVITTEADNCGFAAWVKAHEGALIRHLKPDTTVFGEWCGRGIQKGDAICLVPEKQFCAFAIVVGDAFRPNEIIVEPSDIEARLGALCPTIRVIPWATEPLPLTKPAIQEMNACVARINERDAWVADTFGVEGRGEGLVFYPCLEGSEYHTFVRYMFKAKGQEHNVKKQQVPVALEAEHIASVSQFVDTFVTEARCVQGCTDTKSLNEFLGWMVADVKKESQLERDAMPGVDWKSLRNGVIDAAKHWWRSQNELN